MTASTPPPTVEIHEIQGTRSLRTPLAGTSDDDHWDRDGQALERVLYAGPDAGRGRQHVRGVFVFTSSAPTTTVGDAVRVSGLVSEFRPGGVASANLTTTEITGPPTDGPVHRQSTPGSDRPRPRWARSADGGDRRRQLRRIRSGQRRHRLLRDGRGHARAGEQPGRGRAAEQQRWVWTLADDGAGASVRTNRGGIVIRDLGPEPAGDYVSGDFNPERIQLDDAAGTPTPNVHVGDHFGGPAIGVVDFDFGNYEVHLTSPLARVDSGLTRETTVAAGANELSVATFNVENLGGNEGQAKYDALAAQIVSNMRAPDVVSLEEIQDNNGATNDSVVDANITLDRLVAAIAAAGGPTYQYRRSTQSTMRTAASRAETFASDSSSAPIAALPSLTVRAATRRHPRRS